MSSLFIIYSTYSRLIEDGGSEGGNGGTGDLWQTFN
jgi:hypothetical protein